MRKLLLISLFVLAGLPTMGQEAAPTIAQECELYTENR